MKLEVVIDEVEVKDLVTHCDQRGHFREIIRSTDDFFKKGFAQWSQSLMFQGVTKAWHLHKVQTDYFYVPSGVVRVGLCDLRPDSKTYMKKMDFLMGDGQSSIVVKVPPGIAHGVKAIQGPSLMFYMMTHEYDPDDEIRIPHDDPKLGFDWVSGPLIR